MTGRRYHRLLMSIVVAGVLTGRPVLAQGPGSVPVGVPNGLSGPNGTETFSAQPAVPSPSVTQSFGTVSARPPAGARVTAPPAIRTPGASRTVGKP